MTRHLAAGVVAFLLLAAPAGTQSRGFTAGPVVASAYDLILNADFAGLTAALPATCPPAPRVACAGLEALSLWWQIHLDPANRSLDTTFLAKVNAAIAAAEQWTVTEPSRAEAWFYLGAAYGARAQFRVYRVERLSAARDGKRIKQSLERAMAIDPAMHDAEFGIGLYRYYADVAPAVFRFLRWLLLLPGGDRVEGLQQLERAASRGELVGGEAQYQIHVIYLWYENKFREALQIVRDLQARYPRNPLFRQIEAEILDGYFHDPAASLAASERLVALASSGAVNRADLARTVAQLNIAKQAIALKQTSRAIAELDALIARRPTAPADAMTRARALRRTLP